MLMSRYQNFFQIYPNFIDKTTFIVSKLADESEVEEFKQMTAIDMVETNP